MEVINSSLNSFPVVFNGRGGGGKGEQFRGTKSTISWDDDVAKFQQLEKSCGKVSRGVLKPGSYFIQRYLVPFEF